MRPTTVIELVNLHLVQVAGSGSLAHRDIPPPFSNYGGVAILRIGVPEFTHKVLLNQYIPKCLQIKSDMTIMILVQTDYSIYHICTVISETIRIRVKLRC